MSKRVLSFDVIAAISCFAVVVLHCSMAIYNPGRGLIFLMHSVMQGIFVYAVPLFFMISGAKLFEYRRKYSTREFLQRRLARTIGPLLLASVVAYICYYFLPGQFETYQNNPVIPSLGDFLARLANNTIEPVYWFMYRLIPLYLLVPVLSHVTKHRSSFSYLMIILLLFAFVLPLFQHYGFLPPRNPFAPFLTDIFLTYFLTGAWLETLFFKPVSAPGIFARLQAFDRTKLRRWSFALLLLTLFVRIVVSLWETSFSYRAAFSEFTQHIPAPNAENPTPPWMLSVESVMTFVYSCSWYLWIRLLEPHMTRPRRMTKDAQHKNFSLVPQEGECEIRPLIRFAQLLANLSFGIYLIHMPVLLWLTAHVPERAKQWLWALPPLKAVLVFALSALIMYVVKKLWSFLQMQCLHKRLPKQRIHC